MSKPDKLARPPKQQVVARAGKAERFKQRYGPWAIVTGASSGIGEEFARQLAARGLSVVVVARRRDRLDALAAALTAEHGVEIRVSELDLVAPGATTRLADETAALDVGLVVNNAGFGLKGPFLELPLAEQRRMVELNCQVPLALTHHFGQRLRARGHGGIVIVASTAAFQGLPQSSLYGATKGFDLLMGEGLWDELGPLGIDVLTLCPGPTDTEGPRRTGVNPDRVPGKLMSVEPVVRAALNGLGKRAVVIPGAQNRVAQFLTRMVPRSLATRFAGRMIKKVTSGS